MTDRLLEAREIAELLHVPERWVREHTRSGLLPHVRLGRYRRYRRDAVLAWVNAQDRSGRLHWPRRGRLKWPHPPSGFLSFFLYRIIRPHAVNSLALRDACCGRARA